MLVGETKRHGLVDDSKTVPPRVDPSFYSAKLQKTVNDPSLVSDDQARVIVRTFTGNHSLRYY